MNGFGHLEQYDLKLIAKSPVFIGSGREYNKRDFYFDEENKKVHFINIPKMMSELRKKGLVDEYEKFILCRPDESLNDFFNDFNLKEEIDSMTDYTADAADAIKEGDPFASVMQFMRDERYRPYIPGSSLKGCLRTALLWLFIKSNERKVNDNKDVKKIEAEYLNTLNLYKKDPNNEINSIMRGISISDSLPIDNSRMILTKKIELYPTGKDNDINLIREAVSPGTVINFKLTIDKSVASNLNINLIMDAVKNYASYYKKTYISSFYIPDYKKVISYDNFIVLGGGSGYFGKNIIYPIYCKNGVNGKKQAVKRVSKIMQERYEGHYHEKDIDLGISPHIIKYTKYQSLLYQYGICEVVIN
ncbi:MAG TPA: type III-A CRISPR-associated RAMP protein Csm5 [Mobilitalea sp.]|nr:type III-A CRISPR-associated RAMP protein Csm5 [Mobilitalea sp.]